MKTKRIYTRRMAQHLIDAGFPAVGQVQNTKNISRSVWIFENTPELEAACTEYIENHKEHTDQKDSNSPKFNRRIISQMFFREGLSIETVAKIAGKTEDQVIDILSGQFELYRLFAIATMNSGELEAYMTAQDDSQRTQIICEILKRKHFNVFGGTDSYSFPGEIVAKEANENA